MLSLIEDYDPNNNENYLPQVVSKYFPIICLILKTNVEEPILRFEINIVEVVLVPVQLIKDEQRASDDKQKELG